MKRAIAGLLICTSFLFTGCGGEIHSVQNDVQVVADLRLIQISDVKYYDEATKIVFVWNGLSSNASYAATMPVWLPGEHGFPCKFNTETNQIEELRYFITEDDEITCK